MVFSLFVMDSVVGKLWFLLPLFCGTSHLFGDILGKAGFWMLELRLCFVRVRKRSTVNVYYTPLLYVDVLLGMESVDV